MLKKTIIALSASFLIALSPVYAETEVEGNVAFPVIESSYSPNFAPSLVGGSITPTEGDSYSLVGVEISLDCPLFQPSGGNVRQQFSYAVFSKDDVSGTLIEINPHWMNNLSENVTIGFGPGLGLATVEATDGESTSYFEVGAGVSLSVKAGSILFGADWRQMSAGDFDNSRGIVKAGYSF
ncbi:MAG: hypothetical protein QNL04_03125 [SAR324 cluster bacterium]|nr:hypothetical protein [SAR324 cluster bacterium]